MADNNEKSQPGPRLARGTVNRGHTVMVPHLTEKKVTGLHPETGKTMYAPVMMECGPGNEIELPLDEITSLRERGFLIDPKKIAPPLAEGSRVIEGA